MIFPMKKQKSDKLKLKCHKKTTGSDRIRGKVVNILISLMFGFMDANFIPNQVPFMVV